MPEDTSKTDVEPDTPSSSPQNPPGLVRTLEGIDSKIGIVEQIVVSLCLFGLIGVGTFQFISIRFWDANDLWPFEMIKNLVFFIAMAGAALAAQKGRMITMDFVSRMLGRKNQVKLRMVTSSFVIGVCVLFIKGGLFVSEASSGEHGDHMIDPSVVALAIPVGAGLIALHYLLHTLADAAYLAAGQLPPEEEGLQAH